MSLSGSLSFVTIDEVLRLLTRSKQQGSLDVTGNALRGRVFIGESGIDLATIWTEDELHRHLINSGLADESDLRRVTTEATTLAAIAENNQDIIDLIREMTVESLYQMGQKGEDFVVREGASTPYASPKSFELEHLIQDAEARERDWNTVSDLVPDLTGPIALRRDLGEREEVTIKVDDWKVLSEIGAGASVDQIAEKLGTTTFWTAKVTSRLIQHDLVEPVPTEQEEPVEDRHSWQEETREIHAPEEIHEESAEELVQAGVVEESAPEQYTSDEYEYEPAAETSADQPETEDAFAEPAEDEEVNPNESWWQEPAEGEDTADESTETPEVVAENLSEIPSTADAEEVEEDTEAFLEKVFSELETSEPEADEGHGLLRRRRMGSLRDFSSDS